jgi:hypothetical protein
MKKTSNNPSSKKENKKVQTDKQFKDNEVREGQADSINNEDINKSAYPYKGKEDKQYKTQPEFIDRNSESKDKS